MKKSNCLYLVVTADRYELPVGVFKSQLSISKTYGTARTAVTEAIKCNSKFQKKYRIICVDMVSIPETYVTINT